MFNMSSSKKNLGQSSLSVNPDKLNNFLASSGVEELDDAVSASVGGGNFLTLAADFQITLGSIHVTVIDHV